MNRLKIEEIKRRRHAEKRQKALANAVRSPIERPITYILNKQNRLILPDRQSHRDAGSSHKSKQDRVSLSILPTGYKASRIVQSNDTVALTGAAELVRPRPPPHNLRALNAASTATAAAAAAPPIDREKRDRVLFQAVEIISDWMAAEPAFIDPQVAYGDKNMRFMDHVMSRLREFRAKISPSVMQLLEDATNACLKTPVKETSTPAQLNSAITPIVEEDGAAARTPVSADKSGRIVSLHNHGHCVTLGEFSRVAFRRQSRQENSVFSTGSSIIVPSILQRISPVVAEALHQHIFSPKHPRQYEVDAAVVRRRPTHTTMRGVDLQQCVEVAGQWAQRQDHEILETGGQLTTSAYLRHPIWDTPEECKTYCPKLLLLD
ncbi:unnamed protein product [Mesocestoides corti]|uniref:Uncharacterized protein n=2 Tax=Mesocestoides corti TaxID=53468 RepID=A0A0R3UK92_MESCO|nr:unnamed protein product [Mesocestoides corti]